MPNLFENQTDLKKKKKPETFIKVSVLLFYFILFKPWRYKGQTMTAPYIIYIML